MCSQVDHGHEGPRNTPTLPEVPTTSTKTRIQLRLRHGVVVNCRPRPLRIIFSVVGLGHKLVGQVRVSNFAVDDILDLGDQGLDSGGHTGLDQVDHVTRQNLGYPAHTSADNLEAAAGGLHYGHTEGLCQAFVEEYLTSDQQLVPNLTLLQFSQHLDSILESVLLYHLLQQYPLGAISCYHKIYSNFSIITFTNKLFLAYYWYNFHYQVNTFSIN